MKDKVFKVTVLGCRGSVPVSGKQSLLYGGDTSSYRVDAGDEIIYLDAGSGIYADRPEEGKRVSILLSHWHIDHLAGLGMFLQKNRIKADIYGPAKDDEEAAGLLRALYSPPFWPVEMEALGAKVHALPSEMKIGEVKVTSAEGSHPNGCRIIKLEWGGRAVVYATDFEAEEGAEKRLTEMAKVADLMLYDGQLREDEEEKFRGFGHSTAAKGLEIKRKSGAGKLVIVHHAADRSDEELLEMEKALREKDENCWFARKGEELLSLSRGAEPSEEPSRERDEYIRRTFGRFLTDDVIRKILESGGDIEGRKKKVAMMFTDIRGSTELSESMDAADFIKMLNHYLAEMILIIDSWQGNILEFEGDAIVVVWGAPVDNEAAGWQAASCAVALQNRMEEVNRWNREQGYPSISMGIGIHTGEAILGNVGSDIRTKYDMIGRNVNLTARIQSYAKGGQILVSEELKEELKEEIQIDESGTVTVQPKGIKEEVSLYDMTGCGNLRLRNRQK